MSRMSHRPALASSLNVSRREFLGAAAGVSGALLLNDPAAAVDLGPDLPSYHVRVRRDVDLLSLELTFKNFAERPDELVALGAGQSLVIVRFPPQNLAEAVFNRRPPNEEFEFAPLLIPGADEPYYSPVPPVQTYLSGPSWLVFMVPDGMRIPLQRPSVDAPCSIVDCWLRMMSDWKIRVPVNAVTPGTPAMPRYDETCLEIPFRLFIAPTSSETRWLTSSERLWGFDPEPGDTRELWHAAILSRKPLTPAQLPPGINKDRIPPELMPPTSVAVQARAVFSPDYRVNGEPDQQDYYPSQLPLSLQRLTRHRLVKQMAKGNGWIDAEHLILSALGCDASLSYISQLRFDDIIKKQLAGDPEGNESELAIFKHRIVVGRDQFFVEAYFGFLMPFVFPALAVSLTRRRFTSYLENSNYGPPGAYLLKERFILVQDPLKKFVSSGSTLGRKMPIKKVTLSETTSPLLADWTNSNVVDDCKPDVDDSLKACIKGKLFFIPRRLEDEANPTADGLRWPAEFEDESGQQSKTTDACLLFAQNVVYGQQLWHALKENFTGWKMAAQPISYAPEHAELSIVVPPGDPIGNVSTGQVLARHELQKSERVAARHLAELLRDGKVKRQEFENYVRAHQDDVEGFINNLGRLGVPAEVINAHQVALRSFDKSTLQNLSTQVLPAIQKLRDNFQEESYQDLINQLQRAEQVTSTMETHLLRFGCARVDELLHKAENQLGELASQAKDKDDFLKKLSDLQLNKKDQISKLGDRLDSELQMRLDGLEDWNRERKEIQAYAAELQQASAQAKAAANQYFQAQIDDAHVVLPALKGMASNVPPAAIDHFQGYLAKGMGSLGQGASRVQNGVFAQLKQTIDQGAAMADKVRCGVARPAAIIAGISRDLGALSGSGPDAVHKLANQFSNRTDDMPKLADLQSAIPNAKLFSVLPLREIIEVAGDAGTLSRGQIPSIAQVTLPDHFEQTWEWSTPVKKKDFGFIKFLVETANKPQGSTVQLHISSVTRVETPKSPDQAGSPRGSVTIRGFLGFWDEQGRVGIRNTKPTDPAAVHLVIAGLVDVPFYYVEFNSKAPIGQSAKTELTPHMGEIGFLGPLKFVKDLQTYLAGLMGKGFELQITPEYIRVGFLLPLPPITTGACTLRNISVGASLGLSFTNKPLRFGFNFCSKLHPMELAVTIFGGTAFLEVALLSDGTKELEGAIDFGGLIAFDFGVAYGQLHVLAGFYFRVTNTTTDLSGYLRAGGELFVLGLIHASVEFVLMGRYRIENGSNQIYGICTITVSIDLFLFSADVSIVMEKRIAGSSNSSDSSNGDSAGLLDRSSFRLVGLAQPVTEPVDRIRAYFDRPGVMGRFAYPAEPARACAALESWNRDYWSQFDFA
jgi:hypothetical protein